LTKWLLQQPRADPNSALFGAGVGNRHELVAHLLEQYPGRPDLIESAVAGAKKGKHARLRESLLNAIDSTPNATPMKRMTET
jgi:acetaldehyde dehydrogenase (acetylating)